MEEHIVAQSVLLQRIVLVVALIGLPVVVQFLGAEHQHTLVAVLVILDDAQRREGLTQAYGVCQYAAIIGLEFIDDSQRRILLEVIEFVPNLRRLEACGLVGQHIFADVLQELIEDVVERHEVDEVGGVLTIDILDVFDDGIRHVRKLLLVIPQVVEVLQVGIADG